MFHLINFQGEDDGQIIRELIPYDSTGTRARRNTLTGNGFRLREISVSVLVGLFITQNLLPSLPKYGGVKQHVTFP